MAKLDKKRVFVVGFAMFAMFFGAGNLMFPPSIGHAAGSSWLGASLGFLLSGVGLPLLGVIAFTRCGSLDNFASKVSRRFNTIYCTTLIVVIGPLFAIPRTASTTYEMGVEPLFGGVSPWISAGVFFLLSALFVVKKAKVTAYIGRYLTPLILIILAFVIYFALTTECYTMLPSRIEGVAPFSYGFLNGYQTMDGLGAVLFGMIIINGLISMGVASTHEQGRYLTYASFVSAAILGVIYFSLTYLGAMVSGVEFGGTTQILLYISTATLGSAGGIAIGLCVSLACLTTSIALLSLSAEWFSKITPISYRVWIIVCSLFAMVISINGVDAIIKLSVPILTVLYPLTIVLIFLNIFGIEGKLYHRLCCYVAIVVSLLDVIGTTFKIEPLLSVIQALPLGNSGFAWLIPTVLTFLFAFIYLKLPLKKRV